MKINYTHDCDLQLVSQNKFQILFLFFAYIIDPFYWQQPGAEWWIVDGNVILDIIVYDTMIPMVLNVYCIRNIQFL